MFAFQLLLGIFQFCYDIYIQLYDGRNKSRQTKCLPLVQFHRAIYHSKHIFIKIKDSTCTGETGIEQLMFRP